MIDRINSGREDISPADRAELLSPAQTVQEGDGEKSFASVFQDAISSARHDEESSAELSERFAKGDPQVGLQETIIAAEKASISLRYAVSLKNKLLESYKELINTPL